MLFLEFLSFVLLVVVGTMGIIISCRKGRCWSCGFLITLGVMAILSLPASICYNLFGCSKILIFTRSNWYKYMTVWHEWYFNTGGWSARQLYETTLHPLDGCIGRYIPVMSYDVVYYSILMTVQMIILAATAAFFYRKKTRTANIILLLMAITYLSNSMLNICCLWPDL